MTIHFDRLAITSSGHITLQSSANQPAFTQVLHIQREIQARFATNFPGESRWHGASHVPKYDKHAPHITLGLVFESNHGGLPHVTRGVERSIKLAQPLSMVVDRLSIVHYAYRSLQRCVGEIGFDVPVRGKLNESDIICRLGLNHDLVHDNRDSLFGSC